MGPRVCSEFEASKLPPFSIFTDGAPKREGNGSGLTELEGKGAELTANEHFFTPGTAPPAPAGPELTAVFQAGPGVGGDYPIFRALPCEYCPQGASPATVGIVARGGEAESTATVPPDGGWVFRLL